MSPPLPPPITSRNPRPAILPPLAPSPSLVAALAVETGAPPEVVRGWLAGERHVTGYLREQLLASLWRPLGGITR